MLTSEVGCKIDCAIILRQPSIQCSEKGKGTRGVGRFQREVY